jgi:hypothetical protein
MKLTIAFLAGALAFASTPTVAVDLPDYGSKNFSPSGDTPTYFANENVSVSGRTADTTERDWSAVDEMAPMRPVGHSRSAHRGIGHGRYGRHAAGGSGGKAHMSRTPSLHYSVGHARTNAPASATRTTSARHGKPGAHHASATFDRDLASTDRS